MTPARRALFRASATPAIGGGHVVRCMALADALSRRGWTCIFAGAPETAATVPALTDIAETLSVDESMGGAGQAAAIGDALTEGADVCIVDHYGLDADFETGARSWAPVVLALDDIPGRRHDADILLDQSGGRVRREYAGIVPKHCQVLTGPGYSLLRPMFRSPAPARHDDRIRRVFVSMGATDPDNLSGRAVSVIRDVLEDTVIDIMLSGTAPHLVALKALAAREDGLRLHVDVADVASLLAGADLAVGTAGINLWERCALGVPSLLVVAADNQRDNALFAEREGAAEIVSASVGTLDGKRLTAALRWLEAMPDKRRSMGQRAYEICDGQGAERVADAVEEAVADAGP